MSKKTAHRSVITLATVAAISAGTVFIAPQVATASSPAPVKPSLTLKDAIIDFGTNSDRVTIKCSLDNVPNSTNVADFEVRVIITDKRSLADHDTGVQPPTVVR